MPVTTTSPPAANPEAAADVRREWTRTDVQELLDLPFPELIFRAQTVHRQHFDPRAVQISTLLSIKTGGCPEDCGYCPQALGMRPGSARPG